MTKDYKQFNFNSKEDYLFIFYNLIAQSYQSLRRYTRYCNELEKCLIKLEEGKDKEFYIDDDIHAEWHDKLLSVSRGLITMFVDDVKGGISYVRLRKLLNKTEFKLEPLEKSIQKELEELRDVRNWSYHLPQTNFVAMKEVYYKNIPKFLHPYVQYKFNPVRVNVINKCNIKVLESLFVHSTARLETFNKIFRGMVEDFGKLLGENVSIVEVSEKPLELLGESTVAAQLSMAMNRRKYDGSNENYEKITFQKPIMDE